MYCMAFSSVNALYYNSNLYRPTFAFTCVFGAFRSHLGVKSSPWNIGTLPTHFFSGHPWNIGVFLAHFSSHLGVKCPPLKYRTDTGSLFQGTPEIYDWYWITFSGYPCVLLDHPQIWGLCWLTFLAPRCEMLIISPRMKPDTCCPSPWQIIPETWHLVPLPLTDYPHWVTETWHLVPLPLTDVTWLLPACHPTKSTNFLGGCHKRWSPPL